MVMTKHEECYPESQFVPRREDCRGGDKRVSNFGKHAVIKFRIEPSYPTYDRVSCGRCKEMDAWKVRQVKFDDVSRVFLASDFSHFW